MYTIIVTYKISSEDEEQGWENIGIFDSTEDAENYIYNDLCTAKVVRDIVREEECDEDDIQHVTFTPIFINGKARYAR